MILTYQPSGKFNPLVLTFSIAAGAAMIGLGFVYQKLLSWIPFIYLNALLVIGFAFAGAFVMRIAVKNGKCRNPLVAKLLGIAVGVAAILATHRFAYQFALNEAIPQIMQDEPGVTEEEIRAEITFDKYVELRADEGWSIGKGGRSGLPIKGVFVYLVWLIEAGAVIAGTYLGSNKMALTPYIEAGDCWADQTEQVVRLSGQTEATKQVLAEAGSVEQLIALPTANTAPPDATTIVYELAKSDRYPDEAYLTVALETVTLDKEGKAEIKRDTIWPHVVVTAQQVEALRASGQRIRSDGRLRTAETEVPEESEQSSDAAGNDENKPNEPAGEITG